MINSPSSSPRRILLVVHGYPPLQTTGGELHAQRKARWWRAQGHEVAVLAADPQAHGQLPFGAIAEHLDTVEGIPVRRIRITIPDASRPLDETYHHPLLAEALERECTRFQPDLIYQVSGYIFGVLPLKVAARAAIPSVLFAVDFWHMCQRITLLRPDATCCRDPRVPADCAACRVSSRAAAMLLGLPLNSLGRRTLAAAGGVMPAGRLAALIGVSDFAARRDAIAEALRYPALVVANSEFLADRLHVLGVPRDKMLVMRQGIESDRFTRDDTPSVTYPHGLRVLYLGQISKHKGADLAVTAVARLRRAGIAIQLTLHGPLTDTRSYQERLERSIASTNAIGGQGIHLADPLPHSQLLQTLRDADLLVVPSRWYDNSPNVILEAFSAGVPVVVAAHGGMAAMVQDGIDGLYFRPGDAQSLADALRRLALAPALLERLRAGIRQPHDVDAEMRAEEAVLNRILSTARPGGIMLGSASWSLPGRAQVVGGG